MAPAAFRTVYLSLALIALPQVLAGPACARRHHGEHNCPELCSSRWGGSSYSMGTSSWGPVVSNSRDDDLNSILSSACGSDRPATPDPAVTPTDSDHYPSSSPADGHIPTPSVPGSDVPPHLTSTPSTPRDSGISPTPRSTSSPPPPPATSPTSTSTSLSRSLPNSLSHSPSSSPSSSPSRSPPPPPPTTVSSDPVSSTPLVQASNPNQGGSVSGSVSSSIEQEVLNGHNNVRRMHNASDLAWNQELAEYAEKWASKCDFKHSFGRYGENLAAGTGDYTVTDGINAWANEAKDYDYSNPVFSDITGHFTQLVWRNTSDIGCAMVDCAPGTIFSAESHFLACEYYSPGNVIGQFAENVQA